MDVLDVGLPDYPLCFVVVFCCNFLVVAFSCLFGVPHGGRGLVDVLDAGNLIILLRSNKDHSTSTFKSIMASPFICQ